MSWQLEMTTVLRYLINDMDETTYVYSDDKLTEALLVGAQLTQQDINFTNIYTISIEQLSLSPDPTASNPKDDGFINLVCLKTACIILGTEVRTSGSKSIKISDSQSSLDMSGVYAAVRDVWKDLCSLFEKQKFQYKAASRTAGRVILGPFSSANVLTSYSYELPSARARFR